MGSPPGRHFAPGQSRRAPSSANPPVGQVAGAITAKLLKTGEITVIVVAFRERPRTEAALLVMYTAVGVAGAVVNTLVA